jgi:hypothetical protein
MLSVHHQIGLGSTTYTSKDQTRLVDLRAIASLQIPVNQCRMILAPPQGISVAPSDPVTVKLGYGDTSVLVFTGVVGAVNWSIDRVTIDAVSSFQALVLARFNLLYEKPNAGDIVKDVAQKRLKLKVGTLENGLKFPVYALGDRQSAYEHLATLASYCGFDWYANTEDKLVFAPFKATSTHELSYGQQILQANANQPQPTITGIEIYGESPSSQGQGEQAYAWLTKKEVKGMAGGRSGTLLQRNEPIARTQSLAGKMAQSLLEQKQQKQQGQITVLGDPDLKLGDSIKVSKLPMSKQNGTFKITGVTQRLNRQQGFYTLVQWEET